MKQALLVALAATWLGCGHTSVTTQQVESALAAVQSAERSGAARNPEAAPSLARAESEVAEAQALLKGGKSRKARSAATTAYQHAEDALQIVRGKTSGSTLQAAASLR